MIRPSETSVAAARLRVPAAVAAAAMSATIAALLKRLHDAVALPQSEDSEGHRVEPEKRQQRTVAAAPDAVGQRAALG